jgi:hypothetical protein
MHNRATSVARVMLTCLVVLCGAVAPAAARPQPPVQGAETSAEDEVPAASQPTPAALESESSGRKPIALAQELRLSTAVWPGSVANGVDRFWGEIEYRPRVTGTRSRVSGAAELVFRASMSGFALSADDRNLRIQSDRQTAMVKELSVSVHAPVDFVIGWQILSWGHATDGVRVLDVFQRQDLTDRLRPEPLGVPAVSASFGNRGWETEVVWVPSALTDRIAASPSNVWYAFPRSSTVGEADDTGAPGFALSHGEGGIRVSRYGQHGDFALMAARTRDRVPSVLELRRDASTGGLQARSLFEPYWLAGASVVRTAGGYLLRAEALHAAYSDGGSPLVNSGIRAVAGVERRISASTDSHYTFIAQYAVDTTGSEQVVQDGAFLSSPFRIYGHALTASATAAWRRQYELETRFMRGLDHGSTVASAKLSYTHNDHLTIWVAADQVGGRAGTWLERLDAADRILVGVNVNR